MTIRTTFLNTDSSLIRFNNVFNNSGVYFAAARTKKIIKFINVLLRILTFIPYTNVESHTYVTTAIKRLPLVN